MKKLILLMTMFFVVLYTIPSMAAWDIYVSVDSYEKTKSDKERFRIRVSAVSDGSTSGTFYLSDQTYDTKLNERQAELLKGAVLTDLSTDPTDITAPTWNLTFVTDSTTALVAPSYTGLSGTTKERKDVITDFGIFIVHKDLGFTISDIGDLGDKAVFFLTFDK